MKNLEFETAFSQARLKKYVDAFSGNLSKALRLYRYNIRLSEKFYCALNVFEVVLRNAINDHYKNYFADNDWIKNQITAGGMLEHSPHKTEISQNIQSLINKNSYTQDKIVASATFGFWVYCFTKIPFRRGGQSLLTIFPHKTHGLGQRVVYNELMKVKSFRNRIAHHEQICFDASGNINLALAKEVYGLINNYLAFLGYVPKQVFYGLNISIDNIINNIENLK